MPNGLKFIRIDAKCQLMPLIRGGGKWLFWQGVMDLTFFGSEPCK